MKHLLCAIFPLGVGLMAIGAPAQAQNLFENATIGPGFSPNPLELRGISGGSTPLKDIAGRSETSTGSCLGFADSQPDHILKLTAPFDYLKLQVNSKVDTTMAVTGPGGTWCNDDFTDRNAGIDGQWQAGEYRLWIGTHVRNQTVPYTLTITTQP